MNGRTLPMLAVGVGAIIVPSLWAIEQPALRAALALGAFGVIYVLGYFHDRRRAEGEAPESKR